MNDTVLVLHDFITNKECETLKKWIFKEFESGKMPLLPSAHKGYPNCYCVQNRQDGIKEFYTARDRVIKTFGVQDMRVATPLGHFTMMMDEGASLAKHMDTGKKHFRCNLVIQKPKSGKIYIGKKSFSLNEGDLCCFFPSEMQHWSDRIIGQRLTCSYGFLVPVDWELKCQNTKEE